MCSNCMVFVYLDRWLPLNIVFVLLNLSNYPFISGFYHLLIYWESSNGKHSKERTQEENITGKIIIMNLLLHFMHMSLTSSKAVINSFHFFLLRTCKASVLSMACISFVLNHAFSWKTKNHFIFHHLVLLLSLSLVYLLCFSTSNFNEVLQSQNILTLHICRFPQFISKFKVIPLL
jgi:uncharacterized membrane protein YeiB